MTINPYQAPTVAQPASHLEASWERPPRPIGVWIVAGLHLATGALFLSLSLLIGLGPRFGLEFSRFPYYWLVLAICSTMAVLALATGIGLWLGHKWGWWLTSTYHVWGLVGGVSGLIFLAPQLQQADVADVTRVLLKEAFALAVHAAMLWYLLRFKVLGFFRLQALHRGKALAILLPIAVLLTVAVFIAFRWPPGQEAP
jgi:hypothetical protein